MTSVFIDDGTISHIHYDDERQTNLYLGDMDAAGNAELLEELNIKLIVNCTTDRKNYFECDGESTDSRYGICIQYLNVRISDSAESLIVPHIEQVLPGIHEAITTKKKNVLIHCMAGMSRSASVTIAYFMKFHAMNLRDAFCFVRSKREVIMPNIGFFRQLCQFEHKLGMSPSFAYEDFIMETLCKDWFKGLTLHEREERQKQLRDSVKECFEQSGIDYPTLTRLLFSLKERASL